MPLNIIPVGYCQCRCGGKTTISPQSHTRLGYVKGQPRRFLPGHHAKPNKPQYLVDPKTGCWLWLWSKNDKGYGVLWCVKRKKLTYAHILFYEEKYGSVPNGKELDHVVCSNPGCANPDHVEPVTHTKNLRRGKRTKLTDAKVEEIRRRVASGETREAVASAFSVSAPHVSRIASRKTWRGE